MTGEIKNSLQIGHTPFVCWVLNIWNVGEGNGEETFFSCRLVNGFPVSLSCNQQLKCADPFACGSRARNRPTEVIVLFFVNTHTPNNKNWIMKRMIRKSHGHFFIVKNHPFFIFIRQGCHYFVQTLIRSNLLVICSHLNQQHRRTS